MPRKRKPPFFWIILLLVSVALFFVGQLLAPKSEIEDERPKGLGDFNFPTATEGRAIPVMWGSSEVTGTNTIWYGALSVWPITEIVPEGIFSEKEVTVGFVYRVGFDLAICLGPVDFVSRIEIGDIAMEEDATITAAGDPDGVAGWLTDLEAWGGYKKGGGINGSYRFYDGVPGQNPEAWMLDQVNQDVSWGVGDPPGTNKSLPGYNNLCHFVWRGGDIGESAQIRAFDFTVHRYPNPLGLTGDKHKVNVDGNDRGDANPMNVIYEILTDTDYGLSTPPAKIAIAEFITAGDQLYTEGLGFSMTLDRAKAARNVINEVERLVDGVLYQTVDGLFHFALVRDDYDPETLQVFDESNITEVKSYTRASWTETHNSVMVRYSDRTNGYKETGAVAQDMANIQIQGREVRAQVNFPGVKHPDTAAIVAARELNQMSFPLARVTFMANRDAWGLVPGGVIKWNWARYGISGMILRVAEISHGSITDEKIRVIAYQDIFSLSQANFIGGGPSLSQGVTTEPQAATNERVLGLPRWFILTDDKVNSATVGQRALHITEAPDDVTTAFDAYLDLGGSDFQLVGRAQSMTPTGQLQATYSESAGAGGAIDVTGFTLESVRWGNTPAETTPNSILEFGYGLLLIDDEILAFEDVVDNGDDTYDIARIHRSLLDTVQAEHLIGATVWFIRLGNAVTSVDLSGGPLTFRNLTHSVGGVLDIGDASDIVHTLDDRQNLPLRPGYVRVNGSFYPTDEGSSALNTTWRRRDSEQIQVIDDSVADESTNLPDNYVLGYRRRDSFGVLGPLVREEVVANTATNFSYSRAAYLADFGAFVTGDGMHITLYGRDTGPTPSISSWIKEFLVAQGFSASISTQSLLMNGTAPATDQHYIEGPAFTAIYASDPTVVTWSAWVKSNEATANLDMILGGSSDYDLWDDGFGLHATSATNWVAWFGDSTGGGGGATVEGADSLLDGSWHHICATWDTVTNQTPIVWVDSVAITPVTSNSRSIAVDRGTGKFDLGRLGTVDSPASAFTHMNFDEVAIYDRIFAQKDVDAIYGGGDPQDLNKAGPTPDLTLWWVCGEDGSDDATAGSGQITDVGGNGNDHHGTPQASSGDPSFEADVP